MKNKNLSFSLSLYLICSQIFLAAIIIIVGYWYSKKVILSSLFHELRYHIEEVISPIKTTMDETQWLIDNFPAELDAYNSIKDPERYARLVFKVKPGIIALRFVTFNPDHPIRKKSDRFFYRHGETITNEVGDFLQTFPGSNDWMEGTYQKDSTGWSPLFNSGEVDSGYRQIKIFSKQFILASGTKRTHAIIHCAITLDKEVKSLSELDVLQSGLPILISDKGEIVFPLDKSEIFNQNDNLAQLLKNLDARRILTENIEGSEIVFPEVLNNKKSLALYWPVKSINGVMVVVMPVSKYMSPLNKILFLAIFIILLVGSLSAAFAIYLSRKRVAPITSLADASRKIIEEEGTKSTHLLNEVEILSQSMELMKRKLRNFEKEKLKTEMDHEEMDRELKLAREIEMGIVPTKFPLFPGRSDFDCYGKLIPAKVVGGDLFDFFLLDENSLFLSICDTLGKGIPAAMFAVATRTLIRSIANPITRLGKMMELLNDELTLSHESDMYVTVMMGRLDLTNGEFAYCNAGHPRPFILRNNNQIEEFDTTHGFPIGVRKRQKYVETTVRLNPGETIFAYTDGITEEIDKFGTFFGKERLYSLIQSHNSSTPEKTIKEVLKHLEKFRGKNEIYDDTTMLGVKYFGKA